MKPTIQHRYKLYRQTMLGKLTADEYMDVFGRKGTIDDYEAQNRYSGSFVEDSKWWIACIAKIETAIQQRYYSDEVYTQNNVAFSNMLYMHKFRDMAVLKTSLITYGQCDNRSNVVNNVFLRMLRTLGYEQVDFDREEKVYYRWKTRTLKILIPEDKTEDDLAELLQAIDKYNDFVRMNEDSMSTWENLPRLLSAVKNLVKPENNKNEAV